MDDAGDLVITSAAATNGILTFYTDGGTPYVDTYITFNATSLLTNQTLTRTVTLPIEPRYDGFTAAPAISGVVQ
jgi:hypothetical protein